MFKQLVNSLVITTALGASMSQAASISGEISFAKKPPYAGIIYVNGGNNKVSTPAEMDQKDKKFTQRVVAASKGQTVTFKNSDEVDHNIFANDRKSGVTFDVGLMPSGGSSSVNVSWDNPGLVRIGCKIHPKMRAYIANTPSDHYQVFDFRNQTPPYSFEIKDLPSDAKTASLSIPGYDAVEIDLTQSHDAPISITKKGKEKGLLTIKMDK